MNRRQRPVSRLSDVACGRRRLDALGASSPCRTGPEQDLDGRVAANMGDGAQTAPARKYSTGVSLHWDTRARAEERDAVTSVT